MCNALPDADGGVSAGESRLVVSGGGEMVGVGVGLSEVLLKKAFEYKIVDPSTYRIRRTLIPFSSMNERIPSAVSVEIVPEA